MQMIPWPAKLQGLVDFLSGARFSTYSKQVPDVFALQQPLKKETQLLAIEIGEIFYTTPRRTADNCASQWDAW